VTSRVFATRLEFFLWEEIGALSHSVMERLATVSGALSHSVKDKIK
jgi:hypothetical protein